MPAGQGTQTKCVGEEFGTISLLWSRAQYEVKEMPPCASLIRMADAEKAMDAV
jgi:hypothetical protein